LTEFDLYAFADYSGSKSEYQQRKAIALSVIDNNKKQLYTDHTYTRESLRNFFITILVKASSEKKRIMFGFDHSYSFPVGFYDIVAGEKWETWEQLLDLLYNGGQELPPVNDRPREWAKAVNDLICKRLGLPKGPFWGPNFKEQQKSPEFPFKSWNMKEKRLVEERVPQTKPVYKIGGPGSVGLQSIYGIQNLVELRNEIRSRGIELFCWPFDGWDLPSSGHMLVEIYPKLFNKKSKNHLQDAEACSEWLYEQDKKSRLLDWLDPDNFKMESRNELQRASLEGWIIGVR
jgi:hypothetical protein